MVRPPEAFVVCPRHIRCRLIQRSRQARVTSGLVLCRASPLLGRFHKVHVSSPLSSCGAFSGFPDFCHSFVAWVPEGRIPEKSRKFRSSPNACSFEPAMCSFFDRPAPGGLRGLKIYMFRAKSDIWGKSVCPNLRVCRELPECPKTCSFWSETCRFLPSRAQKYTVGANSGISASSFRENPRNERTAKIWGSPRKGPAGRLWGRSVDLLEPAE